MGLIFDSYVLDFLSILVSFLCIFIAFFKHSFGYWARQGVPHILPEFPFGNTKETILQRVPVGDAVRKFYQYFKSQSHKFGGIYFFNKPYILLTDPELVKNVLTKDFASFSERSIIANEKLEPLTGHLLALSGHKWRNMRQKLTPTFTSGKMKMMFQTIIACANGLEEILDDFVKKKEVIDIKDMLARYATDIIGSCAFGLECNSLKNPDVEFRIYGKKVFTPTMKSLIKIYVLRLSPWLFNFLKLRQIDEDIHEFFMKVIADTIEYREKNNVKRNDFLQLLINIKNTGDVDAQIEKENGIKETENVINGTKNGLNNIKNGMNNLNTLNEKKREELSLGEIAAQSYLFFLAGFETSSTAMSLFLYDMALHQDIQDKVRTEINEMLKKYDNKLTYEGIIEMQYLEKALFESMRLHSAIPILQRKCTKNYKIPDTNVVIEKGIHVMLPVYGLHSDPEYYPHPEKYDPERFSPEQKEKRHPFTFLPFGEGPRNCIGLRFGLLQSKAGLCILLKNHKFTLNERTKVPLGVSPKSTIISIIDNVWLHAERI